MAQASCDQRAAPPAMRSVVLKTRSMPNRIVNLVQRQVRPMVRGKARAAVEFGALAHRASACGRLVFLCGTALPTCIDRPRNTSKSMDAIPSESAQIASTSIPRTETFVLATI